MPKKPPNTLIESPRRLTAVELFCGVGGMGLGFEQAGFDVLAAVDLDPLHLAAHQRNFPRCEPLCADISDLEGSEVVSAAQKGWKARGSSAAFAGPVDCVFGGPSCQGFSVIGRRDPDDPRNALVSEFARLVLEIRPRWFVLENVPGFLSDNYAVVREQLYSDLKGGGYSVAEPWLLDASDFRTPQERRRVFVVGARAGQRLPTEPAKAPSRITVSEALGDLVGLSRFQRLYDSDRLQLSGSQLARMVAMRSDYVNGMNGMPARPGDLSNPRNWNPLDVKSVALTRHSDSVKARFRGLRAGQRDSVGRLPRLDLDAQSPTLRAGTGRDHGSFTSARPVHPTQPRVITVREAARLHGFPDWFDFHATKWHGFRQVGNAVPPPLARSVSAQIAAVSDASPFRRDEALDLGSPELLEMTLSTAAEHFDLDSSELPVDVRRASPRTAEAA